jgi:hypothetical protein
MKEGEGNFDGNHKSVVVGFPTYSVIQGDEGR